MKAAILNSLNQNLNIYRNLTVPALKHGQVLVKISFSGVCRSQLMEARGLRGGDKYLPHMMGHEGTGVVVDAGEGVTKVKSGDKVVLGWIKGDGLDAGGTVYEHNGEKINAGPVTTFSDYAIVSENRCYKLPEGIPMDVAVLFGCAVPTGAGIVINEINPQSGSSIAIFGLGGIGMSALMGTQLFDLSRIIAVDISEDKLELATEFGATNRISPASTNPVEEIMTITAGKGVDYSVDATGLSSCIEQAFAVVRKNGGLCIFASHPPTGEKISLDPHDLISGKQIRGSWGGNCNPERDIPRFAELYRQGKLPLEKLLSKRYSLEQINHALGDLENGRITRALIDMSL